MKQGPAVTHDINIRLGSYLWTNFNIELFDISFSVRWENTTTGDSISSKLCNDEKYLHFDYI